MTQAYSHVAGKIGVATVIHGAALTNCMTALTEGAHGHMPLVLLAGDTPVDSPRHLQRIDQRELVKATGAGFEQVRAPDTVGMDLSRAFYRARAERRPIILNMPADFMWQEVDYEACVLGVFIASGGGAVGARDQLIRLEAPLATTLKAKGLGFGILLVI